MAMCYAHTSSAYTHTYTWSNISAQISANIINHEGRQLSSLDAYWNTAHNTSNVVQYYHRDHRDLLSCDSRLSRALEGPSISTLETFLPSDKISFLKFQYQCTQHLNLTVISLCHWSTSEMHKVDVPLLAFDLQPRSDSDKWATYYGGWAYVSTYHRRESSPRGIFTRRARGKICTIQSCPP